MAESEARLLAFFEVLLLEVSYTNTRVKQEEIAEIIAKVKIGANQDKCGVLKS
jgi:hypothetical protein